MVTQDVIGALRALEDERRRITPEVIVTAASDPASPLHEHFEWDDSAAAHAYRLWQARELIYRVQVQLTVEEKEVSCRYYARDPEAEGNEQGYVATEQLRHEPENAQAMVEYYLRRALTCLGNAERLAQAVEVAKGVRAAKRIVARTQQRIRERASAPAAAGV